MHNRAPPKSRTDHRIFIKFTKIKGQTHTMQTKKLFLYINSEKVVKVLPFKIKLVGSNENVDADDSSKEQW